MGNSVSLNGTNYNVPDVGESWGQDVTNLLIAMVGGLLQKAGGSFTLTADIDFGANYGVKSIYYKSRAAALAGSGIVRLGNDEEIAWRDQADSADKVLKVNTSDRLEFAGDQLPSQAEMDAKLTDPMTTEGDLIYETGGVPARLAIGSADQVLKVSGGVPVWGAVAGTGDVVGPASSTDNGLARWDGVGGDTIQDGATGMADGGALDHARTATAISANTAGESYVGVTDTSSPRTITLSDVDKVAGRTIMIKDESGGAQSNNITVAPQTGTVDGEASIIIGKNYGSVIVYSDGSNWFTIAEDNVANFLTDVQYNTLGSFTSDTGDTHSGTAIIDNLSDTSNLAPGMFVSDDTNSYIPFGTYIVSVDSSTQITVSKNSTGDGVGSAIRVGNNLHKVVKSGAGRIHQVYFGYEDNVNSLGYVVAIYDKATFADPSADTPIVLLVHDRYISTAAAVSGPLVFDLPEGLPFSTGLTLFVASVQSNKGFPTTQPALRTGILYPMLTVVYS